MPSTAAPTATCAWCREPDPVDVYRLVLTVLVMAAVVVAILLFEKRRAQGIERDTRDMARGQERLDEGPGDNPPEVGPGR